MSRTLVVAIAVAAFAAPMAAQRGGRAGGAGANVQAELPPGDAANGRALVGSTKCLDCHRIGDTGSRLGPDLSDVGRLRSPDSLQRALVAPDDEVQPEHRFARVVTRDGTTVTGRLLNQDTFSVLVLTEREELKSYARSNLREYTILDRGLMPSYKDTLTPQQIADIVNYLATLKPVAMPGGGRQ